MAHECPECGQSCHCGGDIECCDYGDSDAQMNCTHCDDADETDDDFFDERPPMTADPTDLMPCPFCNGPADWMDEEGATGTQFYVHCQPEGEFRGCIRQEITYARKTDAIRAWNTRAAQRPTDKDAQDYDVVELFNSGGKNELDETGKQVFAFSTLDEVRIRHALSRNGDNKQ